MRLSLKLMAITALAAAASVAVAGHAAAAGPWGLTCPTGCLLPPFGNELLTFSGLYDDDYTVPADGRTHLWTFRLVSDDPNATASLRYPNQDFTIKTYGDGHHDYVNAAPFTFDETVSPLLTTIKVWTLADYNHCSPGTPPHQLCAASYNVWGNGGGLYVNSNAPVTLFTSDVAVPEPDAWWLMTAGVGAVGAVLRRRRIAAPA